ncbi:MAG: hypothetical protein M3Q07_02665 [Pseudobdellovibrionaceae bacterium]|nr:hypothetical protein [Pseudobdellovibrionaceae bacterium]
MRAILLIFLLMGTSLHALDAKRCLRFETLGRKQSEVLMQPGAGLCQSAQDHALVLFNQLEPMKASFADGIDQTCWYMGAVHGVQLQLGVACSEIDEAPITEECQKLSSERLTGSCQSSLLDAHTLMDLHQHAEGSSNPAACYQGISTSLLALGKGGSCD